MGSGGGGEGQRARDGEGTSLDCDSGGGGAVPTLVSHVRGQAWLPVSAVCDRLVRSEV